MNKSGLFSGGLLLMVVFLAACSGSDTKDEPEPAKLKDFKEEVVLEKVWSTSVGDGLGEYYNKITPAIDGDTIYVADIEGVVTAIDKADGKDKWEIDLQERIMGGVGAGNGLVLIGTIKGAVVALNEQDGSQLWRTQMSSEVLSAPQTTAELVIAQTQDGHVVALDKTTGQQKWVYNTAIPVLTLRGTSAPLIFDNFVYAAFSNGKVVCLSLDQGNVRWENRVAIATGSSELERVIDIDGGLLIRDNILYAISYQGRVVAIDLNDGQKLWKKTASSYVGLGEGFGNIYTSEEGDVVKALNRTGGTPVWVQEGLTYRRLNSPTTIRNYVAVADYEGYVHFLSQVDGHFVAREKIDGGSVRPNFKSNSAASRNHKTSGDHGVRSDMIVDGDMLYVYGNNGNLVALRVE